MKQVVWLYGSRVRLKSFPRSVQKHVGQALFLAQDGQKSDRAKPLHGMGSGVFEIVTNDTSGTYRAVYSVSIGSSIYVLHVFQKKSKSGISTPKSDMEIVRQRILRLRRDLEGVVV